MRMGPGKVFGETCHIIPEFKGYQPCSIQCVSLRGEVLRVSGHEFVKKFLNHESMRRAFQESSIENLQNFRIKKIMRF